MDNSYLGWIYESYTFLLLIFKLLVSVFWQLEPFLKGGVIPVQDTPASEISEIDAAVETLKSVLADVQRLQIKLRV